MSVTNKLKYTTNQLVYFISGQEAYIRGYDVDNTGVISYVVTIRDRGGLQKFESSMFEKETMTKLEYDEYSEKVEREIMNKVISKFNFPDIMIGHIYKEVLKLNEKINNVYECLNIIEEKLINDEITFLKLRNELLKKL